jgi:hypothetical protein
MTTRKVVQSAVKEGAFTKYATQVTSYYRQMSPFTKKLLVGYGLAVTATFATETYNVGKSELKYYRIDPSGWAADQKDQWGYFIKDAHKIDEWTAVKNACKKDAFCRFASSVLFPYMLFNNVVPTLVIGLSKKEDPPDEDACPDNNACPDNDARPDNNACSTFRSWEVF